MTDSPKNPDEYQYYGLNTEDLEDLDKLAAHILNPRHFRPAYCPEFNVEQLKKELAAHGYTETKPSNP